MSVVKMLGRIVDPKELALKKRSSGGSISEYEVEAELAGNGAHSRPDFRLPHRDQRRRLALGAGASHGYAVGKEIEARSDGRLRPTTGSLYQALKRLSESGLIERAPEAARISTDGPR